MHKTYRSSLPATLHLIFYLSPSTIVPTYPGEDLLVAGCSSAAAAEHALPQQKRQQEHLESHCYCHSEPAAAATAGRRLLLPHGLLLPLQQLLLEVAAEEEVQVAAEGVEVAAEEEAQVAAEEAQVAVDEVEVAAEEEAQVDAAEEGLVAH